MSSVTVTTTPSAPSPTTAPSNPSSPRRSVTGSPSAVTISIPATAALRFRLPSPEPWVAVAIEPATEMCGSEARLPSAYPASCSRRPSSAYRRLAPTRTVRAASSISKTPGRADGDSSTPEVSAMSLKECPLPSVRTVELLATSARSSSSEPGRSTRSAWKVTLPAQLVSPPDTDIPALHSLPGARYR